jgi:predicted PurR-regulated permease PerM
MKKGLQIILYTALVIISVYFLFVGLKAAKSFLVPLATAMVLAFLMLPVSQKLEKWGFNRLLATITSTISLLLLIIGFTAVIFYQIKGFSDDWEKIQERLNEMVENVSGYIQTNTPFDASRLLGIQPDNDLSGEEEFFGETEGEQATISGPPREQVMSLAEAVIGFLTDILIVFVYVFLFIHFRDRFKEFIMRFFPKEKRNNISGIISRSVAVSRRYLAGKLLLMVFLAILYFIGLIISGLENALLISLLAAALSIIPIVGNVIGYFIALAVGLVTGGDLIMFAGITLTFIVAQFVDTYILQPIVLGKKTGIHPFFVILSVVLGYEVWGIMGMVLSIPIFGIITIICRNVPVLSPFGYLFSNRELEEPDQNV